MLYFTTSWDDGDVLDLKLSQMLDRYNVKGTFYITQNYRGERLSEKEISHLALNNEVLMFCYPFGYYDSETIEVVKECGFRGARITGSNHFDSETDAFQMPTTLQVYPFPFRKKNDDTYYWRYLLQPWRERSGQLHELGLSYLSITSWGKAARKILELSASHDIVFHLWGHSWEIEKYGMWQELEELP